MVIHNYEESGNLAETNPLLLTALSENLNQRIHILQMWLGNSLFSACYWLTTWANKIPSCKVIKVIGCLGIGIDGVNDNNRSRA